MHKYVLFLSSVTHPPLAIHARAAIHNSISLSLFSVRKNGKRKYKIEKNKNCVDLKTFKNMNDAFYCG